MVKVRIGGETHRLQELLARFPAGSVIFREGDLGREMFIIQKGHVRISLSVGDHEQEVAVLEKGDFFGEMALLEQSPARSATAVAVGPAPAAQAGHCRPDDDEALGAPA
ncbi:MAG: hypothetical protein B7Z68_10995 [Acidobacteria bacterium 21-70-11]|nr:MAG: hypothetical protein B7Z68_10995 [Acidobacteria bacterium 21-70-11]